MTSQRKTTKSEDEIATEDETAMEDEIASEKFKSNCSCDKRPLRTSIVVIFNPQYFWLKNYIKSQPAKTIIAV